MSIKTLALFLSLVVLANSLNLKKSKTPDAKSIIFYSEPDFKGDSWVTSVNDPEMAHSPWAKARSVELGANVDTINFYMMRNYKFASDEVNESNPDIQSRLNFGSFMLDVRP